MKRYKDLSKTGKFFRNIYKYFLYFFVFFPLTIVILVARFLEIIGKRIEIFGHWINRKVFSVNINSFMGKKK